MKIDWRGVGLTIPLHCDLVFAADKAKTERAVCIA